MESESRRAFMKRAAVASAVGAAAWNSRVLGANDRIRLGLIGGRNRGSDVALDCVEQGAEIATFCDIDDQILAKVGGEIAKAQGKAPNYVKDFRKLLDDPEIDGVIVGTPDHWHAIQTILACQAGKDVYVEKPLSQTIEEGQLMRDAARRYSRVVQVGTQRRSGEHYASAAEYVKSGKLGKVCLMKAWMCQVRKSIGNPPAEAVPAGVDYDMWLGPAPNRPFNRNRFHYNWRFFWDYGNSELGNQGIHMLDIAMWAIQEMRGLQNCLPSKISGNSGIYWLDDAKEVPDTQTITYDYGDFMLVWELQSFQDFLPTEGRDGATAFYGTEGALVVDDRGWVVHGKDGQPGPKAAAADRSHGGDFLASMRTRKPPRADIEVGRLSTTLCHLGNICCRLGRDVRFDPATETFPGDDEANRWLRKEYRNPWLLPRPS